MLDLLIDVHLQSALKPECISSGQKIRLNKSFPCFPLQMIFYSETSLTVMNSVVFGGVEDPLQRSQVSDQLKDIFKVDLMTGFGLVQM